MARFADALEDALRPVHDAGRGDALRIVRDERAGGEAAGVHIALTPLGSRCTKNKGPFACARDISDEKL